MAFYSFPCSLYHPWLRYSQTHSFIRSARLASIHNAHPQASGCVRVATYPLCGQGVTVFLPSLRLEASYWCGEHITSLYLEKLSLQDIEILWPTSISCYFTRNTHTHTHMTRTGRGYVSNWVRSEKRSLAMTALLFRRVHFSCIRVRGSKSH